MARLQYLVGLALLCSVWADSANHDAKNAMEYLKAHVPTLRKNVMDFWLDHGYDKQYGAFFGTLDTKGKSVTPFEKGLFQTGRHLWAMSYYYKAYGKDDKVKAQAVSLFKFLKGNFYDKSAQRLYFKVGPDGKKLDGENVGFQTQANWFGLLGIAQYALVFRSKEAADLGLSVYAAWRKAAWDEKYGGWIEDKDVPHWNGPNVTKSINVHTHGAEALSLLYQATKSKQVGKDLAWLTKLCATKIILPTGRASMGFTQDWKAVEPKDFTLDFSAEMQTWMLLSVVEDNPGLFSSKTRKVIVRQVLGALRHAVSRSFDKDTGSFCSSGSPDEKCVGKQKEITWYYQTEGANGLHMLYKYSKGKDRAAYLKMLAKAVKWASEKQTDWKNGEMYYTVDLQGNETGQYKGLKGLEWKASYHSGRMVMFLEQAFH